jgi:tRNA 2-thiouridine synthesizing protein D
MADFPDFLITLSHNKSSQKHVTLAFTLGLKALEKDLETAIVLFLDGVYVASTSYVDDIDIGEPFLPVKDMLEVYLDNGGELLICGSCWKHEKLTDSQRIPGARIVTADTVVDMLLNAKTTLQLN